MQNRYSPWVYWLLVIIAITGIIYALPNVFGEDPSVQISAAERGFSIDDKLKQQIDTLLTTDHLKYKAVEQVNTSLLYRFYDSDTELHAADLLKSKLGSGYTVAATITPATPKWLSYFGAKPMKYGLDLRGGIHFLMDVDIEGATAKRMNGLVKSIGDDLRTAHIRYAKLARLQNNTLLLSFRDESARDAAFSSLRTNNPNLQMTKSEKPSVDGLLTLTAQLSPMALAAYREYTIDQAMTILRSRVNELGIGEALVQRQGTNRIAVDLPGIQDAAHAKEIIRGTATVEFHMVDEENDARTAKTSGIVPIASKLYEWNGRPILFKNEVILSGNSITNANSTIDPQTGTPAVEIQLGGGGESLFSRTTAANVGKGMGIVYVELKTVEKMENGKLVHSAQKVERVISVANIRQALHTNFIITGLTDMNESRNLALFLRTGALPAAIYPVEERLVGPTLGQENIQRGLLSLAIGIGLILLIMPSYYRLFGLFANMALIFNLILLVAVLSLMGATLTLPGIAGLVLTVGMAVDANVLIYERIREELRHGITPQAAIFAGYERAFSTIVDANVTCFITIMVLYAIGTGPIQGFAVVTAIGILTSMLTGITFTRAMVNLWYGRQRHIKTLSIGTIRMDGKTGENSQFRAVV